jgi:hypothetical protein
MDLIFRDTQVEWILPDWKAEHIIPDRFVDQFSETYDKDVTARTLELIEEDQHHLIVAYHQQYDDVLHESGISSERALEALENHIRSFTELAQAVKSRWTRHNWLIAFAPDHGAHTYPGDGTGTHGEDIPEDMEIDHFYGLGQRIY